MASNAGQLVVSLGLDAAQYVAGLTKSEYQAKKFSENLGRSFTRVAAGVTATAAAALGLAAALSRGAESIAVYQDIAEKIGDTAEAVSGLQAASDRSGVSLEAVAAGSVKLSATLSKTGDEAKGAGEALAAIGLSLDAVKAASPVERLQLVADALNGYADSSEKTAIAVALLGRSGAELLPYLNDLADAGSKNGRLTKEQIAEADKLVKSFGDMRGEVAKLSRLFISDFTPGLNEVVKAVRIAYAESGILKAAFIGLGGAAANLLGVTDRQKIQKRVAEIDSELETAKRQIESKTLKPSGTGKSFFSFLVPDVKLSDEAIAAARRTVDALEAEKARLVASQTEPPAPVLPKPDFDPGAAEAAANAVKRRLDLAKAGAEAEAGLQRDLQGQRLAALDAFNAQGLLSISDYYDRRRSIIAQGDAAELRAIDAAIGNASERRKQAAAEKDFTGETSAIADITRLLGQRRQIQARNSADTILDTIKQQEEEKKYKDQIEQVNVEILTLTGNTLAAAEARQKLANEGLRKQATASGDTATIAKLNELDRLTIAQAGFSSELEKQGQLTARLALEEERIQNSQRVGAISELEALNQLGAARKRTLADYDAIVQRLEAIAKASQNPALLLQAEQARAALERLRGETDLLAQKFDTIFKDSFSSAFSDFVSGTKTAKEAFNDFASSVTRAVTDLIAQDLSKQLFKSLFGESGSGGASGLGSIFSGLFGGGNTGGSGGGLLGSLMGLLGGGSGGAGWTGAGDMDLPSFAVGTPYVPHDMLAFVHKGERITPASENSRNGGGGNVIHMNITTPDAGSFRASRGQLTAEIAATLQAARRNL